jgi:TAG lipase / steryl ester hydrolase / phospholipase A2 / LPA acyltransferase
VTLAARDRHGERQPYVPSRQWVDGSVTDDLPAKRLIRLYGVNHFITSQTNPLVCGPFATPRPGQPVWPAVGDQSERQPRAAAATYPFAMEFTRDLYPLNVVTRMFYSIATQDYTADINILPRRASGIRASCCQC